MLGKYRGEEKDALRDLGEMFARKQEGVMRSIDFKCFNQALLANCVWRILCFPSSLAVFMLKVSYFPSFNIIEATSMSYLSALVWGQDIIFKVSRWRIRSENLVDAHSDCRGQCHSDFHIRYLSHIVRENLFADLKSGCGEWNVNLLHK